MNSNNITRFNQQLENKSFQSPVGYWTKWTICGDTYKFECNCRYYNNKSFLDCTYLEGDNNANYIMFDISTGITISFSTLLPNTTQILINILIEKNQITNNHMTELSQRYNEPCVFLKIL